MPILIDAMEKVSADYKERRGEQSKLALATKREKAAAAKKKKEQDRIAAAANGGPAGKKKTFKDARDKDGARLCNYCNKANHLERECNKKKADLKAGRISTPGQQQQPQQPGPYPPCIICKKTNHKPEDCYFKDRAGGRKAAANISEAGSVPSTASSTIVGPVVEPVRAVGDLNSVLAAVIAKKAGLMNP